MIRWSSAWLSQSVCCKTCRSNNRMAKIPNTRITSPKTVKILEGGMLFSKEEEWFMLRGPEGKASWPVHR